MSEAKISAMPANPQNLVQELKVSGHLMPLDAGLFCIFNAPGSPVPDPKTGLPGVRVSVPPGPGFRPEAVTISSFRDDGWLGGPNGAALVRVTGGPAFLLVTIYQAPGSTAEAPKLQILRLQEGAAQASAPAQARPAPSLVASPAPARPAAAAPATPPEKVEIVAHIQSRGDVAAMIGEWMGEAGSQRWIEGFAISPKSVISPQDIEYQAVLGRGWLSPWAEGGQFCGSRGMSLPILGLRARLRGESADDFDCVVEATFVDGTRVGPMDNGEPCQAESLAPLEAFRIQIVPRAGIAAPAATPKRRAAPEPAKPAKSSAKPAAKTPSRRKA